MEAVLGCDDPLIDGMTDQTDDSSLDIFDLLRDVFDSDVDLQGVKNMNVPDMYKQHLEYVQ